MGTRATAEGEATGLTAGAHSSPSYATWKLGKLQQGGPLALERVMG